MLRRKFRPSFLSFLAESPHTQAMAVLRWNDCRDYLDAMLESTLAAVTAACERDALEYAADYAALAPHAVRITRAGIAEVANIMLRDCVAMAAEWQGPPDWLPYAEWSAMRSGMRRCEAGFRSPSIRQPW